MEPNIARLAQLIADEARAKMLLALLGGQALTATELALEAEITPQTASSHLNKLVESDFLCVRKQGRHKYFQLKNHTIAELIEQLLNVGSLLDVKRLRTGPNDQCLRTARICYDHLAGSIAVQLLDLLLIQGWLVEVDHVLLLTNKGREQFTRLGVDFDMLSSQSRPICKACLDWSERRSHLAGQLGQWILNDLQSKGWAKKDLTTRAFHFTEQGLKLFLRQYTVFNTQKQAEF